MSEQLNQFDMTRAKVAVLLDRERIRATCDYVMATTRDAWECDQWRFTLHTAGGSAASFDYFTGLGHRKKKTKFDDPRPVAPHPADVLQSLLLDGSACEQSFASWAEDYGYGSDSIKAREIYDACQQNTDKLARLMHRKVRAELQKLLQDY